MSILETVIVVGVTIGAVIALLLFVWALVLRSRHEVYIAPFQVAGSGAEPALGAALTNMLRARLERLKRELAAVQRLLEEQPRPTGKLAEDPKAIVLPSSIEVPRGVFEPVNIDVSIGKVSVGGLLSWVQQWALESRTLQFTVFLEADHAIVSASLDPLSAAKIKDLWIETGTSVEEIVRKTAHALLQSSGDGPIAALDLDEFESLLLSLYDLADLNRRALSGVTPADSVARFDAVLQRLTPLTERFPDWDALVELAANVAEKGNRADEAELLRAGRGRVRAPAAVQVPVDEPAKAAEPSEVEFVASAHAFYRRYFTDRDPPPVVFKPDVPVVALWNSDSQGYEVNPDVVNRPGMDGYVALMGRFMQLHYTRCIEGSGTGTVDTWAWNEIRNSVVAYLVFTDPEQPANLVEPSTRFWPLWDALVALDEDSTASRDELRRLAFALLEGFECDWRKESLYDRIVDTNEAAGTPVPDEALSAALKRAAAAAEPI